MFNIAPSTMALTPATFYSLVAIAEKIPEETLTAIDAAASDMDRILLGLDEEVHSLSKATDRFMAEVRANLRRKEERPTFKSLLEEEDPHADIRHTATGAHYLALIFAVYRQLQDGARRIHMVIKGLRPGPLLVGKDRNPILTDIDQIQRVMFEVQINEHILSTFVTASTRVDVLGQTIVSIGRSVEQILEGYHRVLVHRHSVEGTKIHSDPISTDVALLIYENVDSHGEIQDGKKPDEVSAYSLQKALVVIDAVRNGVAGEFVKDPKLLTKTIADAIKSLWFISETITGLFEPTLVEVYKVTGQSRKPWQKAQVSQLDAALQAFEELDPRGVTYKDKVGILTAEEKFEVDFRNDTLKEIVYSLKNDSESNQIINWVLQRKADLRRHYMEENSFYTCKMGSGNPFTGEAPGGLTVVPATRPVVNLDEIAGSGYDEIKDFIGQIDASAKFHDLFVATSPSRSGDKSNVLLIGPQGCGKSEVLRAVGSDKDSIGIFAQGSDFLTCWKGEAEKNPKRLFEEALRIQKESGKHVHILIDEIDTILSSGSGRDSFGGTDLRTEFQILMDGIVRYPHLSIWSATNNPEKMPMTILRRFNKVLVVGELDQADRMRLLKHFASFLPVDIPEESWAHLARRLEGATGDVVRKIVDHVWREKLTSFVKSHKEDAARISDSLNINGQRFSIGSFTAEARVKLHKSLRPFFAVREADIDHSITVHLENVSVYNEIKTAIDTYSKAKSFLGAIRSKNGATKAEVTHPPPS